MATIEVMAPSTSSALPFASSFRNLPWRNLDRAELLSHIDPLLASSTPRAGEAYKFLQRVAGAAGASWRELPIEVYVAVLETQAETVEAFTQAWAANVAMDDKASREMLRRVVAVTSTPGGN